LVFVWVVYLGVGDGVAMLYTHDPSGISDNILANLPQHSLVASLLRVSMACVCLLSYPLALMSPAMMIERYVLDSEWLALYLCSLFALRSHSSSPLPYDAQRQGGPSLSWEKRYVSIADHSIADSEHSIILEMVPTGRNGSVPLYHSNDSSINSNSNSSNGAGGTILMEGGGEEFKEGEAAEAYEREDSDSRQRLALRVCIRVLLVSVSTIVAGCVPCFGAVVSLLGCCTVSVLSFVLPPFFHLRLVSRAGGRGFSEDLALTVLGSVLCVTATSVTVADSVGKFRSGASFTC
jgi:amino acid permease